MVESHPCPCGKSSDAFKIYEDGSACSFSAMCKYRTDGDVYFNKDAVEHYLTTGEDTPPTHRSKKSSMKKSEDKITFVKGEYSDLKSRGISKATCEFFGYQVGKVGDSWVQIANWFNEEGETVGQKFRNPDKEFWVKGDISSLFGKRLWTKGKFIVITEGEVCCLSYAEATGCQYPVVSIPNGASAAKRSLQKQLRWLEENFETIILAFDNDAAGKLAATECAELFQPKRVKIADLGEHKDINDMLVNGAKEKIRFLPFNAKHFKPAKILYLSDLKESIRKPLTKGVDTPFDELTALTYGVRPHEVWVIGAGTGMGKTTLFKEFVLKMRDQGKKCGLILLEEVPEHTSKNLIGMYNNKGFHLDNSLLNEKQISAAEKFLEGDDGSGISIYDNFGCNSVEDIKQQMYWMINSDGCDFIFLDHITALSYSDPKKQAVENIDAIMQDLAVLTREKPVTLFIISHLRKKSEGKSYEDGAEVSLDALKGSGAIKQWASFVLALEGNLKDGTNNRTLRILKDRLTGESAGKSLKLHYDSKKCRLAAPKKHSTGFATYKSADGEEAF